MKGNTALPVLMYHSVGRVIPEWAWSDLTVPADVFEDHLAWLKRAGYQTVGLEDCYNHVSGEVPLPPRSVVLTFDDGYVDNWTYVAPLLARYGFWGTIFVSPDFVDPRDIVRPTLNTVWRGEATANALEVRGFMSWPELKKASESGVLSVQSHAMTHTWYPVSDKIEDFHSPGNGVYWLDWNAFPEKKPFYLQHLGSTGVPYGTPIYEHAKSLSAPRFFPDEGEAEFLVDFVARGGGLSFFARPGWRRELMAQSEKWRSGRRFAGRPETPEERAQRLEHELLLSKLTIEQRLGYPVDFLVWPGGGYDDEAMKTALGHYKAVTVSSSERWRLRNFPNGDPRKISRRGVPSVETRGGTQFTGGRYLIEFLKEFQGSGFARKKRQVMKVIFLAASNLGLRRENEL